MEKEIHLYENTKKLKVELTGYHDENDFTRVKILEKDHKMQIDQKNGISNERLIELMQKLHHGNLDNQSSIKSIDERFYEIIENIETGFFNKNKLFTLNISIGNLIIFEVINRNQLEEVNEKENGYGINLVFGDMNKEFEAFQKTHYSTDFTFLELDEFLVYQKDCNKDLKQLLELIKAISYDVFLSLIHI